MNKMIKKVFSFGLIAAMAVSTFAACGSTDSSGTGDTVVSGEKTASGDTVKIGVLVSDVSGEEALGFRSYYENYIASNYDVEFTYTDELADAAAERSAIEGFVARGYDAIISLASSDRALQIETCEENGLYYAIASGMLDDDVYEQYKTYEYFVGEIGPSMATEYEAGLAMGQAFADKGITNFAMYGAFIPNPMHVYRAAGVLVGLGCTYGGASDMDAVVGQIFADQGIDTTKVAGDIDIVAYLQGYGDTTTDEINAAIAAAPEAFISVGMATTFFTQQLNAAGIQFSDIDSFTESNGTAIKEGSLCYLAGKYSSCIGPVFALVMNAVNGNVIRDAEGNAVALNQGYNVATDAESFDAYYVTDNGDTPIYDKASLDTIIGDAVTYDDIAALVASK